MADQFLSGFRTKSADRRTSFMVTQQCRFLKMTFLTAIPPGHVQSRQRRQARNRWVGYLGCLSLAVSRSKIAINEVID